jgi:hypothetical protein
MSYCDLYYDFLYAGRCTVLSHARYDGQWYFGRKLQYLKLAQRSDPAAPLPQRSGPATQRTPAASERQPQSRYLHSEIVPIAKHLLGLDRPASLSNFTHLAAWGVSEDLRGGVLQHCVIDLRETFTDCS